MTELVTVEKRKAARVAGGRAMGGARSADHRRRCAGSSCQSATCPVAGPPATINEDPLSMIR